jgi:hypothetical protein
LAEFYADMWYPDPVGVEDCKLFVDIKSYGVPGALWRPTDHPAGTRVRVRETLKDLDPDFAAELQGVAFEEGFQAAIDLEFDNEGFRPVIFTELPIPRPYRPRRVYERNYHP